MRAADDLFDLLVTNEKPLALDAMTLPTLVHSWISMERDGIVTWLLHADLLQY